MATNDNNPFRASTSSASQVITQQPQRGTDEYRQAIDRYKRVSEQKNFDLVNALYAQLGREELQPNGRRYLAWTFEFNLGTIKRMDPSYYGGFLVKDFVTALHNVLFETQHARQLFGEAGNEWVSAWANEDASLLRVFVKVALFPFCTDECKTLMDYLAMRCMWNLPPEAHDWLKHYEFAVPFEFAHYEQTFTDVDFKEHFSWQENNFAKEFMIELYTKDIELVDLTLDDE